jgi:hypothetical protein
MPAKSVPKRLIAHTTFTSKKSNDLLGKNALAADSQKNPDFGVYKYPDMRDIYRRYQMTSVSSRVTLKK